MINASTEVNMPFSVVVTDANGSTDEDTILVEVYPMLAPIDLGIDVTICPGENIVLDATVDGGVSYAWSNGTVTPTLDVNAPGTYFVQVTTACDSDVDTLTVFPGRIEVPEFIPDYAVCDLEELFIGPDVADSLNYAWLDDPSQNFPREVFERGLFSFEVSDNCGVRFYDIAVSEVNCDCAVYIPNSFTPNGDFLNDAIFPVSDCGFTQFDFQIYNRWGDRIFQTTDPDVAWVGSSVESGEFFAPDGIYHWMLKAVSISINGELIQQDLKGSIHLLR
jgi:hypothetical protein